MELEFDGASGYALTGSGLQAQTTLRVGLGGEDVRLSLRSSWSHSQMGLGVGLDPDEAERVATLMLAYATVLREETVDGDE